MHSLPTGELCTVPNQAGQGGAIGVAGVGVAATDDSIVDTEG